MDHKLSLIEKAAMEQNSWHAICIYKDRHRSGTVPNGTIAFVRNAGPWNDALCGTASWAINDLGVYFYAGHYDLSRDEAMEDFTRRVEALTRVAA